MPYAFSIRVNKLWKNLVLGHSSISSPALFSLALLVRSAALGHIAVMSKPKYIGNRPSTNF